MDNRQLEHLLDLNTSHYLEWCIKVTSEPTNITNEDLEVLKCLIRSSDDVIRAQAIVAIGAVSKAGTPIDKGVINTIKLLALDDDSAHVRCSVMLVLPELGINIDILRKIFEEGLIEAHHHVRMYSLEGIFKLNPKAGIVTAKKLIRTDNSVEVRLTALGLITKNTINFAAKHHITRVSKEQKTKEGRIARRFLRKKLDY